MITDADGGDSSSSVPSPKENCIETHIGKFSVPLTQSAEIWSGVTHRGANVQEGSCGVIHAAVSR